MSGRRIGVLIGRFSGLHRVHMEHIERAAYENDMVVIILGSPNRCKSIKNPWSFEERKELIHLNINSSKTIAHRNVSILPVNDHPDDEVWRKNVHYNVDRYAQDGSIVTLYGSNKDASSYYTQIFPEWKQRLVLSTPNVDAATIRECFFDAYQTIGKISSSELISEVTKYWLAGRQFDRDLQNEWKYFRDEQKKFANYPYPETLNFCCADAVLCWNGYVLMIKRKFVPGKDCWALTGGFKNRGETFFQAAVRELYEEASPEISMDVLMKAYLGSKLFDSPFRSVGIPRITEAHYFDVTDYFDEPPKCFAGDDAAEYMWVNIADLTHLRNIHDDHAGIVLSMM